MDGPSQLARCHPAEASGQGAVLLADPLTRHSGTGEQGDSVLWDICGIGS
jgi:hypothetical protein